jgi:hypothetical protein
MKTQHVIIIEFQRVDFQCKQLRISAGEFHMHVATVVERTKVSLKFKIFQLFFICIVATAANFYCRKRINYFTVEIVLITT